MINETLSRETLLAKRESLMDEIFQLEEQLGFPNPEPWGSMEWRERSIQCIASRDTYSTTIDVLKCLISERRYNLLEADQRDKYIANLSIALNGLAKEGYITKVKIPGINKGYYFGLPKWFENNGTLKSEYANEYLQPVLDTINSKLLAE